ncbi:DUF1090 family protein [Mangrovibacter phragmitis]|nr:DUF1090 family protein [Mangrovibacter phragmitis]
MNYRTLLVCTFTLLFFSPLIQASTACQDKQQDILREISYAKKHHNQRRIDGLNKALAEVRSRCREESHHSNLSGEKHKSTHTR